MFSIVHLHIPSNEDQMCVEFSLLDFIYYYSIQKRILMNIHILFKFFGRKSGGGLIESLKIIIRLFHENIRINPFFKINVRSHHF